MNRSADNDFTTYEDPSGMKFHELSLEEMASITGGEGPGAEPQGTPSLILTAVSAGTASFAISWTVTGAFNC